jgi:hypothetical protein
MLSEAWKQSRAAAGSLPTSASHRPSHASAGACAWPSYRLPASNCLRACTEAREASEVQASDPGSQTHDTAMWRCSRAGHGSVTAGETGSQLTANLQLTAGQWAHTSFWGPSPMAHSTRPSL